MIDSKLEHIISGYHINRDDAAWLRAVAYSTNQPATSEPRTSDALPELPEPADGYFFGVPLFTEEQMHAHYRKGWAGALAQSTDAKDAARYRWLRDKGRYNAFAVQQYRPGCVTTLSANSIDRVIDAAMQGRQEGEA